MCDGSHVVKAYIVGVGQKIDKVGVKGEGAAQGEAVIGAARGA